ncbi:MAG TPA: isoprenylcysteine carboxylmethyltransferase family protein [Pyrinomonadaceae bacterium]|nr:isoprenylcysteine carboxylmethyltransferase family protein [Pyrinomonadaceae bacterium]
MRDFFDYFQIASVITFLSIVFGRALYLRLSRNIHAIAIGGGKTGLVLAVELISFAGLVVWMIEIFLYALHSDFRLFPSPLDASLFDSNLAKTIGVALVSVGLIIFVLAFVSFGDSWRVGFDTKTPGALVTAGLFAFTRNPIYVFLDLWFLGIFLINGRLIFLIFALLAFASIHWQILKEERFCANLYGQPYKEYCERTGRYF